MPIAAKDATDRVEQLTILTDRLVSLVESEIEFLKTRRPSEITAHTQERDKLAAIYAKEMSLIRQDKSMIAGAKPTILSSLKDKTARFRELLSQEESLLGAMRAVSEGILKSVAEQSQTRTPSLQGYGKDAGLRSTAQRRPAALALNQTV